MKIVSDARNLRDFSNALDIKPRLSVSTEKCVIMNMEKSKGFRKEVG